VLLLDQKYAQNRPNSRKFARNISHDFSRIRDFFRVNTNNPDSQLFFQKMLSLEQNLTRICVYPVGANFRISQICVKFYSNDNSFWEKQSQIGVIRVNPKKFPRFARIPNSHESQIREKSFDFGWIYVNSSDFARNCDLVFKKLDYKVLFIIIRYIGFWIFLNPEGKFRGKKVYICNRKRTDARYSMPSLELKI
jgi:hypothetical protein